MAKEKDLLRVPPDSVPLEQAAMLREAMAAYRLLEDHAALKVGAAAAPAFLLHRQRTCFARRTCVGACGLRVLACTQLRKCLDGAWKYVLRLLGRHAHPCPSPLALSLQPGDAVILNAANGTVGQMVVQLCSLLRLRAIALVSGESDFEKTAAWLRGLGAEQVLLDSGSIKVRPGLVQ